MRKAISLMLIAVLFLSLIPTAFATATLESSSASKLVYSFPKNKGDSSYSKIVMSAKGKVTISLNTVYLAAANVDTWNTYKGASFNPAVEVKIFKVNSNGSLTVIEDFDMWKKGSITRTLDAGTYKLQVYAWNPNTTAKSYFKSIATAKTTGSWAEAPKATIKAGSNCKVYNW